MPGDSDLIQIVDAAMAEAAHKCGTWLVCKPGCFSCCLGPFEITPLDAIRLRRGLEELTMADPARASRVRERVRHAAARLPLECLESDKFDEEPCPVLDPDAGTCDLYSSRPITCRTFGPPVRVGSESIGVCELCFEGAGDEEIAACEVAVDPGGIESELLRDIGGEPTIVAFALSEMVGAQGLEPRTPSV